MKRRNLKGIDRRAFLALLCTLTVGMLLPGPSVTRGAVTVPVEEWVTHYNGPGNGFDYTEALAVDGEGNVYVTGGSEGTATGYDYATIKYDATGGLLWVARYNGLANDEDRPYSLAVDPAGNVYVTGSGTESGTGFSGFDYATVKYDPDGTELWVARYNGPGNDGDSGASLGMDPSGNVYVTGRSTGDGTDADVATIKYDNDGNEVWVARYNGPGNGGDSGNSLGVDASGNVYVTGSSVGDGTDYDYVTIKYDPDGNEVWVARFNGAANDSDSAQALTLDAAGNVYVTGWGTIGYPGDLDYVTVKYDPNGNQLWVSRYAGPYVLDRARSVAVDQDGNVYVTGDSSEPSTGEPGLSEDYATVKYDPDGNELWVARYDEPQDGRAFARGVAVDQNGNVYVAGGTSTPSPSFDHACRTIKYDTDGNVLRVATHDFFLTDEYGRDLVLDDTGNMYVIGTRSINPFEYSPDFLTIKYVECLDNDEDGYGSPTCGGDDCDDSNPGVNPGAAEICDDPGGVDEDCDGLINEADPDCICNDNDGDGFGDPASIACERDKRDCDDTNPDVYPGAPEIPGNGIDDDCDPSTPSWGTPASIMGDASDRLSNTLGWALLFVIPAALVLAWKAHREKRARRD